MSLLDTLTEKAKEKITDPDWVEKLVDKGREESDRLGDLKPAADAALDKILKRKHDIADLGGIGFTVVLSHLALGRIDDAKLLYLRENASFEERMKALDAAYEATQAEKKAWDEAWDRVKDLAKDIFTALGKAALPFLLALI